MEKNKKNKNYYKKNNYKNNYNNKYKKNNKNKYHNDNTKKSMINEDKRVSYDTLMHSEVITNSSNDNSYDNTLILKCIAVSAVIFAIIIGSLILFRVI